MLHTELQIGFSLASTSLGAMSHLHEHCSISVRHAVRNPNVRGEVLDAISSGARTADDVCEALIEQRAHHNPAAAEAALDALHSDGLCGLRAFAEGVEFAEIDAGAVRMVSDLAEVAEALIEGGAE